MSLITLVGQLFVLTSGQIGLKTVGNMQDTGHTLKKDLGAGLLIGLKVRAAISGCI